MHTDEHQGMLQTEIDVGGTSQECSLAATLGKKLGSCVKDKNKNMVTCLWTPDLVPMVNSGVVWVSTDTGKVTASWFSS